ncbi:MAG: alkaline phosphatase family protein [Chroococcales cyanobacterium]
MTKHKPILAIGLDAADPILLEKWMSQGHLPTLNQLRQQGAYGRLFNTVNYNSYPTETASTERLWVMFGTGCLPNKTGYWSPVTFDSHHYQIDHDTVNGAYDYQEYPPFYALGDNYQVAVFDVPVSALSKDVNGIQILGWGGHAPHTPSHSLPADALPDLVQKYGKNPVLHQDYGYWWNSSYLEHIQKALKKSIETRTTICQELLQQQAWDLFLTVFGETHTAGHDLWHLSQADNPLYPHKHGKTDPMLRVFQEVDKAIATIIDAAPKNASIVIFAAHGMGNNVTDMYSMTFLPEVLYRWNFPGKYGIARGKIGTPPPPPHLKPHRKSWSGEIWQQRYDSNPLKRFLQRYTPSKFDPVLHSGTQSGLVSPYALREQNIALNWMPAMWYSPCWPQMKAFALPAFAAGHIRINVQGREANGIVSLADYEVVCNEIIENLYSLTDSRSGKPIVKDIVRTRHSDNILDNDPTLPDADLVVLWHEFPTDVIESPAFGRIGPVTYYRSGGHRPNGFLLIKDQDIAPGTPLSSGQTLDIAPTILQLMGAPIPEHFDGKPLLQTLVSHSIG